MMIEEYSDVIEAAVTPSLPDLLEARSMILATLAENGSLTIDDLTHAVLRPHGIAVAEAHGEQLTVVVGAGDPREDFDPNDPVLLRRRARRAVRESLGILVADGLVMLGLGDGYGRGSDRVPMSAARGSTTETGSVGISDPGPSFMGGSDDTLRWRLVRPASHPVQRLAQTNLLVGLEDLLRPRGVQVLEEAIRCFQSGRYLASVDLLAAASEAAWFTLGGAVKDDGKLASLVAGGERAAQVIEQTKDAILRAKALDPHRLHDVRARAAHLRELRNYGLHPVGPQQDEHEEAFTEAGAALLFMSARSYFLTLCDALTALQENPVAPGGDASPTS